ncbi:MAG: LOG family protein, partial [Pseudomonadota bacterium]|nr:LOG family protein [Pseudomonadota bacterium]
MAELSDAFVILPGGLGTLDEMFEILTWRQLRLHEKPIIIANIDRYWDPLEKLLQNMTAENYISGGLDNLITFVTRIDAILPILRSMPPASRNLEGNRL